MNKLKDYGEGKRTTFISVTRDITNATLFSTDIDRQLNMLCGLIQDVFTYRILLNTFLFWWIQCWLMIRINGVVCN